MNGFVADNVIAGSVTAVATQSDILSLETTGFANLERKNDAVGCAILDR